MPSPTQLGLFGGAAGPAHPEPASAGPAKPKGPQPAEQSPALQDLGRRLPANVRLGTSSWSFPGWGRGLVYDREYPQSALSKEGLRAYSQHPLLRTVGVDASFYRPQSATWWAGKAAQVPEDFRFLIKAWREPLEPKIKVTEGHQERWVNNPMFLNAQAMGEQVVQPAVEGLGDKLGVILLQLTPFPVSSVGDPMRFAQGMERFLSELPRLPGDAVYALELRTPGLQTHALRGAMERSEVVPCLTVHPTMPHILQQAEVTGALERSVLVVRWMLQWGLTFAKARDSFAPFDKVVAPDDGARDALVKLIELAGARPGFYIVNNKAEGSSPESARRIAERAAKLGLFT